MNLNRREFVKLAGLVALGGMLLAARGSAEEMTMRGETRLPLRLTPDEMFGSITKEEGEAPIPGATWYVVDKQESGLTYRFPAGTLAKASYLTADLLLDGDTMVVFAIALQEGEKGPRFGMGFSLLNQCQARMRVPLEAVDQNRWRYEREGAWLKPMCWGDRVDLGKVDRLVIAVSRKTDSPARFCLTPITVTAEAPERIIAPILPKGPLLDELGQSTLREWPGKSKTGREVTDRLNEQVAQAPRNRWPDSFSRWGGWKERKVEATGFFRTHHDGQRWWLVDPEGYLFWSTGPDCVSVNECTGAYGGLEKALSWMPEPEGEFSEIYAWRRSDARAINYLTANLIRAFGPEWHERWAQITLGQLKRLGFNTVANWSDWEIARGAGFPYVRPLDSGFSGVPHIFRDFPDVYHPDWPKEAARFAEQSRETRDDPALIGYFLMNEPTWGFTDELPAAGMLYNTPSCETRKTLAEFLRKRYQSDAGLASAWGEGVTFASVAEGAWDRPFTDHARADLEAFSTVMVDKLFRTLSEACHAVDPNHLNLGARYGGVPPEWALKGMDCFDVFSFNCYEERVNRKAAGISAALKKPILIGEWHFGALDVGLPASGLGRVEDQEARGQAYRIYLEDAAAQPWCVGAHWFTLYDQSAIGRFDGECYNIGFLDVCNRPYEEIGAAARLSHERLYGVASGEEAPYDQEPKYLTKLFL